MAIDDCFESSFRNYILFFLLFKILFYTLFGWVRNTPLVNPGCFRVNLVLKFHESTVNWHQ